MTLYGANYNFNMDAARLAKTLDIRQLLYYNNIYPIGKLLSVVFGEEAHF